MNSTTHTLEKTMKPELSLLLNDLAEIYQDSDIRRMRLAEEKNWAYSLISGSCVTPAPLLLGFNWGVGKDEDHPPQPSIEETDWVSGSAGDLGSMIRVVPYLRKHFPEREVRCVNQSNYCFFRSKTERQISSDDLERCRPLFDRLIALLQPSAVVCLSGKLRDYLISTHQVKVEELPISYKRGKRQVRYLAMKGQLNTGVKIYFLPHPNYPMEGWARNAAWDFCFGKH